MTDHPNASPTEPQDASNLLVTTAIGLKTDQKTLQDQDKIRQQLKSLLASSTSNGVAITLDWLDHHRLYDPKILWSIQNEEGNLLLHELIHQNPSYWKEILSYWRNLFPAPERRQHLSVKDDQGRSLFDDLWKSFEKIYQSDGNLVYQRESKLKTYADLMLDLGPEIPIDHIITPKDPKLSHMKNTLLAVLGGSSKDPVFQNLLNWFADLAPEPNNLSVKKKSSMWKKIHEVRQVSGLVTLGCRLDDEVDLGCITLQAGEYLWLKSLNVTRYGAEKFDMSQQPTSAYSSPKGYEDQLNVINDLSLANKKMDHLIPRDRRSKSGYVKKIEECDLVNAMGDNALMYLMRYRSDLAPLVSPHHPAIAKMLDQKDRAGCPTSFKLMVGSYLKEKKFLCTPEVSSHGYFFDHQKFSQWLALYNHRQPDFNYIKTFSNANPVWFFGDLDQQKKWVKQIDQQVEIFLTKHKNDLDQLDKKNAARKTTSSLIECLPMADQALVFAHYVKEWTDHPDILPSFGSRLAILSMIALESGEFNRYGRSFAQLKSLTINKISLGDLDHLLPWMTDWTKDLRDLIAAKNFTFAGASHSVRSRSVLTPTDGKNALLALADQVMINQEIGAVEKESSLSPLKRKM